MVRVVVVDVDVNGSVVVCGVVVSGGGAFVVVTSVGQHACTMGTWR